MSRISDVLKNKNKVERLRKARRKSEITSLKDRSAFKAKLYDELQHVEIILSDANVDAVRIEVPEKYMNQFSTSIYTEDLAGYDVIQVDGKPNQFFIRRKFISF